jgi:type IV pilus assembly protein PilF
MRLNEPRLAEDSFRRAIALNGRDANILHNLGWLQCTLQRYAEADQSFAQALANPAYAERPRTLMTQGVCQIRAGRLADAERTFTRAYELDAANPVTGYNLADLLFKRGEYERAQFYIRRLNNTTFANAQTLWLGIKVERQMQNREAMLQLADQLRRRFSQSKEMALYDRGAFNE